MTRTLAAALLLIVPLCAAAAAVDVPSLEAELRAAETAFARTMADRDHEAFKAMLADDVIFIDEASRLDGRDAVAAGWAAFFTGDDPLFSWEPEIVAVVSNGDLGLTSGPVFNAAGERVATFNSVWRRGPDGWRIVLDRGCGWCE